MKLRLRLPVSVPGQFFFSMGIIFVAVVVIIFLGIQLGFVTIATREIKNEFGSEKTFIVDKERMTYRAFRPITRTNFDPNEYFYYVQEADNSDADEHRIIIRRKKDGMFFAAKLKNPSIVLQKEQRVKITLVHYWRSPTALSEYLVAEP